MPRPRVGIAAHGTSRTPVSGSSSSLARSFSSLIRERDRLHARAEPVPDLPWQPALIGPLNTDDEPAVVGIRHGLDPLRPRLRIVRRLYEPLRVERLAG